MIIVIAGTARTGTCFLGRLLGTHPDTQSFVEPEPLFQMVTEIALHPSRTEKMFPNICEQIKNFECAVFPKHPVLKIHPALWITEKLFQTFPDLYVVAIRRKLYATVASMLQHGGVLSWANNWDKYEIPNKLLGITEKNKSWYEAASLPERCALRWHAHNQEISRLFDRDRFHVVDYDGLMVNREQVLKEVAYKCGLSKFPFLDLPDHLDRVLEHV